MEECVINYKGNYYLKTDIGYKKIILTTDQDLINDGVQAIDDEFLEWFVKNPSCESVEVKQELGFCINCEWNYDSCPNAKECLKGKYKIIIPQEEPKKTLVTAMQPTSLSGDLIVGEITSGIEPINKTKQETLEEAADRLVYDSTEENKGFPQIKAFILGAKWQAKRMYSEDYIVDLIQFLSMNQDFNSYSSVSKETAKRFFEQFKKK
jgi:hypothetical protein